METETQKDAEQVLATKMRELQHKVAFAMARNPTVQADSCEKGVIFAEIAMLDIRLTVLTSAVEELLEQNERKGS